MKWKFLGKRWYGDISHVVRKVQNKSLNDFASHDNLEWISWSYNIYKSIYVGVFQYFMQF